jgi:hypothetical protein
VAAPDPPAVCYGHAALRDYLARPDHNRVTRMPPAEFARWLELEVLTYMGNNVSASLRVRADVIRQGLTILSRRRSAPVCQSPACRPSYYNAYA